MKPEQAPALGMDMASSATCIPPASRPALFSDLSRPSWQLGVNGIRCIHVMTQSKIELYILKIVWLEFSFISTCAAGQRFQLCACE